MSIDGPKRLEYPMANFNRQLSDVVQEVHDWLSDKFDLVGRRVDHVCNSLADAMANKSTCPAAQLSEHIKGSIRLLAKIVVAAAGIASLAAAGGWILLIGVLGLGAYAAYQAALVAEKAWVGGERMQEIVSQAAKAFLEKGFLDVWINSMLRATEYGIETSEEVQHTLQFFGALGKVIANSLCRQKS